MKAGIQHNAEIAVRRLLKETYTRSSGKPLEAVDYNVGRQHPDQAEDHDKRRTWHCRL